MLLVSEKRQIRSNADWGAYLNQTEPERRGGEKKARIIGTPEEGDERLPGGPAEAAQPDSESELGYEVAEAMGVSEERRSRLPWSPEEEQI